MTQCRGMIEEPVRPANGTRRLRRALLNACVVAPAAALALGLSACSPSFLSGAAVGAVGAGAAYEHKNSKELRELERAFERGEISKKEYLERKDEIEDRSIVR